MSPGGSTSLFFFSSRRRHTRFDCDWSSDVCSSDLYGRSAARVIVDEEHTRLIETVLATTRNRLIVVSDKISPEVVTKEFLARAIRLCESNVQVRFVFRRFMGDEKTASHIKEILEDATLQSDGRFSWVQVNTHAKVIIADDSAVVTSFNPLSFAGAFPEQWVALG